MPETAANPTILERECSVFSRYLIGKEPSHYVKAKYLEAHSKGRLAGTVASRSLDTVLLRAARIHPWAAQMVDSYARLFCPATHARKKLVLLLAILESCAPTHEDIDSVDGQPVGVIFAKLLNRSSLFIVAVFVGMLVFFPFDAVSRAGSKLTFRR